MSAQHILESWNAGEDNKLKQISAARELLKPGVSLRYKFNESWDGLNICIEEHCVSRMRGPTADIITTLKTQTGSYPNLFLLCCLWVALYSSLPFSLWGLDCIPYPALILQCPGPSLLNTCSTFLLHARGSYPPRQPYQQLHFCLPSIWSKGTAVEQICEPASVAAWIGCKKGKK